MFPRFFAILLLVTLAGCEHVNEADQQAAIDCVRANVAAMERGDLEAAMATIHPKSASFEKTRQQTEAIFANFDLKMELESVRVARVTADGIEVAFVQVTRKLAGPEEFMDNRVEGTHLLKRDGRVWKIWSSRWSAPRTLDGRPLGTS